MYKMQPVTGLHDSITGNLTGFLGADGKEYQVAVNGANGAVIGNGAFLPNLTNPAYGAVLSANNYIQDYIWNQSNGVNASADFIAYPDNGTDASGWMDMGITSSGFSQAAYGVTVGNEGYIFMSALAASGKTGNMILCTDSTGTTNYVQIATGGFTTKNNIRAQFDAAGIRAVQAGSGLLVKEGSNCKQGVATLVAGTVVVANTSVTANSRIILTPQETGLFTGSLRVSARTAGTSFTILSTQITDTAVVAYQIFEPA